MVKRLLVGLVLGVVIGAVVAAAVVKGLGVTSFAASGGAALAYISAVVTGVLAGLVAGKPVWAKGAWIEVGLKAFFGSLLAAGAMFALRKWGSLSVDVGALGAGALGDLPVTSLPIISTVLGVFYELDNTDPPEAEASGRKEALATNKRVAPAKKAARVAEEPAEGEEEEHEPKKRMKK